MLILCTTQWYKVTYYYKGYVIEFFYPSIYFLFFFVYFVYICIYCVFCEKEASENISPEEDFVKSMKLTKGCVDEGKGEYSWGGRNQGA